LLDFHVPLAVAMRDGVPELEATLAAAVRPPVEASQSGFATISRALQDESLAAAERAELLAAPLLLVVLLLVFRSVLAALIPLAFGAMTLLAGRGVLALLTGVMPIDALSLVVCTMMGLALGVDYSLLIVTRFREELGAGRSPSEAAGVTRATAGRTTAIAGTTLFFSIFLSAFFQPGTLLVSLATALAVVTAIAVVIAGTALPALLTLLGPRINAGRIGNPLSTSGSRVAAAATATLRRPAVASALIAVPLLLLSAPALAFDTGSPGINELSPTSQARKDSEAIADTAGAGWQAPFIFTLATEPGPITSPARLALLETTQRRIEHLAGVRAVIGPSQLAAAARPLRSLLTEMDPRRSHVGRGLAELGPKLRAASGAVRKIRGGLQEASAGGGLLAEGSARGGAGAELLAAGLKEAGDGGEQARQALERLATGSGRLAEGQRLAASSAYGLSRGLATLLPTLRGQGLSRARRLSSRLRQATPADPSASAAAHEAEVLVSVLSAVREELARLRGQARGLKRGLAKLHAGGGRLSDGSAVLATRAAGLHEGLRSLQAGAERLAGGLGELEGGAQALGRRLAIGSQRAHPLQQGLARAGRRVSRVADPLERRLHRLDRLSPHLLGTGYVEMAALAGAGPVRRSLATEVINVPSGGDAARYLVVPDAGFNDPRSRRLGSQLQSLARSLDRERGLRTGVSGGAAVLNDYGSATKARLPLVVIAIVAITFVMLVAMLRAPVLAALTVGLNLLSVAAAIGVVTLSCQIPAGYPLGGHPYIDTVGAGAIFGVTFGLSIDYAVFLLARMREKHRAGGDNEAAIKFGLEKTAGVITGAAAIMAAVFISFAIAPVATVSQMGLGLTVAILLDATIVRILLLPALMLLIGERVWRTPPWLDRLLPGAGPLNPTSEGAG
jgi:RND superfamily putative drug exporter